MSEHAHHAERHPVSLRNGSPTQTEWRSSVGQPRMPASRWSVIGDVAKEFSITLRALRFYESKGLISPLRQGSQRLYSATDRARIGLILSAKELGFTLAEISTMLDEGNAETGLNLGPEVLLRQIAFMEKQHKSIETALAALRMRYYNMTETA
jgi:DNA-binding transcriptional MerR regulator